MQSPSKNFWNYTSFFILAALWGGSFTAIKYAVLQFPPYFSAFLRVAIAQLVLAILIIGIMQKSVRVPLQICWKIWGVGLFALGIPFFLLFWGERFISPGLAGILNATVPIWALILSLIFMRRSTPFSPLKLFGLLIGLFGICIIFWPMLSFNGQHNEILGCLAIITMALSYAIAALLNQRVFSSNKVSFYANIFHQSLSSTVFLLLASLCLEKWPSAHMIFNSPQLWIASIYLGLFSTAIAWLLYYHLIREWGAVRASSVTYVCPLMAIVWGWIFFNNYPRYSELLGAIIILSAVLLIQFSKKKSI